MKNIKVVHFVTSLEIGGAQTVLCTLLNELKEINHEVWYIHDGPIRQEIESKNIHTRHLSGLFGSYGPSTLIRLIWWLWTTRPDCVHTILWSANLLGRITCKFLGIRCISSFHNHKKQDGRVRNLLDKYTHSLIQEAVAVSDEVKQSLSDWCSVPLDKVRVVVNGIKVEPTHQGFCRTTSPFEPGTFIFGSVGRLEPVKEFDLLIKSFALVHNRFPHVRLLLVGGGSQEQYLQQCAQDFHVENSILFTGSAPASRYVAYMDCFVMSSGQEGISMALLYAMSCGLCCVVRHPTKHHPVITNGKTGIVVADDGSTHLWQAMQDLVTNSDLRQTVAFQGKKAVAEGFCEQVMVSEYQKIFTNG